MRFFLSVPSDALERSSDSSVIERTRLVFHHFHGFKYVTS